MGQAPFNALSFTQAVLSSERSDKKSYKCAQNWWRHNLVWSPNPGVAWFHKRNWWLWWLMFDVSLLFTVHVSMTGGCDVLLRPLFEIHRLSGLWIITSGSQLHIHWLWSVGSRILASLKWNCDQHLDVFCFLQAGHHLCSSDLTKCRWGSSYGLFQDQDAVALRDGFCFCGCSAPRQGWSHKNGWVEDRLFWFSMVSTHSINKTSTWVIFMIGSTSWRWALSISPKTVLWKSSLTWVLWFCFLPKLLHRGCICWPCRSDRLLS